MTNRVFTQADRDAAEQLFKRIEDLSTSGPYHPGVTRPSYSTIETYALNALKHFAEANELVARPDAAANLWIDEPYTAQQSADPSTIWIGSHIDSVPNGGNYDGLAGIVAGLLVLAKRRETRASRRDRINHPPIRVIALRGEESAWYGIPYIGAKALLGKLTSADLARTSKATGMTLREDMLLRGAYVEHIERGIQLAQPAEFWELHIEQGPVLVAQDKPVGIVTDIRGNMRHLRVLIRGQAGHSGTVPFELRHDAVAAFAAFMAAINEAWKVAIGTQEQSGADLVVTCGSVKTHEPCNITRIPDYVEFSLEWRSLSTTTLVLFASIVEQTVNDVEARHGVRFEFDRAVRTDPAKLDEALAARAMLGAVALTGVTGVTKMPSGAGHDAAVFANAGIPTGMIFVRNANGSHNPDEAMDMDDFMDGVEVLYHATVTSR